MSIGFKSSELTGEDTELVHTVKNIKPKTNDIFATNSERSAPAPVANLP